MCSLINKQLLLTAYAYLFITEQQKAQQGSEALQLQAQQNAAPNAGNVEKMKEFLLVEKNAMGLVEFLEDEKIVLPREFETDKGFIQWCAGNYEKISEFVVQWNGYTDEKKNDYFKKIAEGKRAKVLQQYAERVEGCKDEAKRDAAVAQLKAEYPNPTDPCRGLIDQLNLKDLQQDLAAIQRKQIKMYAWANEQKEHAVYLQRAALRYDQVHKEEYEDVMPTDVIRCTTCSLDNPATRESCKACLDPLHKEEQKQAAL